MRQNYKRTCGFDFECATQQRQGWMGGCRKKLDFSGERALKKGTAKRNVTPKRKKKKKILMLKFPPSVSKAGNTGDSTHLEPLISPQDQTPTTFGQDPKSAH